jgi:signal transduction histidine kinase
VLIRHDHRTGSDLGAGAPGTARSPIVAVARWLADVQSPPSSHSAPASTDDLVGRSQGDHRVRLHRPSGDVLRLVAAITVATSIYVVATPVPLELTYDPAGNSTSNGVVTHVVPGSYSWTLGLRPGDRLTIDGPGDSDRPSFADPLVSSQSGTIVISPGVHARPTIWYIVAVAVGLLGMLRSRRSTVTDTMLMVAVIGVWELYSVAPRALAVLMWLAAPVAAVVYASRGAKGGRILTPIGAVVGVGLAGWIGAMHIPIHDWSLVYAGSPLIAVALMTPRAATAARRSLRAVLDTRTAIRRVGVDVSLASMMVEHVTPGRAVSSFTAGEVARALVATDIHDEVMPRIAGLILRAEQVGAHSLAAEARGIEDSIRTVVRHERPIILEVAGLPAAIESLVRDTEQRHGLEVRLSLQGTSAPSSQMVSRIAYRAAQEWLENVGRHAGARTVRIVMSMSPSCLELRISDDGRPVSPAQVQDSARRGHVGLPSLVADAQAIGARVEIRPGHLSGTELIWGWGP